PARVGGVGPVACPSATECVTAGDYTTPDPKHPGTTLQLGDILTGSGRSWKEARAPLPPQPARRDPNPSPDDPDVAFGAIACPSVSSCVVAGSYANAAHEQAGLIETGSGTSWRPIQPPGTADSRPYDPQGQVEFSSVACPAVSACVAAGFTDAGE